METIYIVYAPNTRAMFEKINYSSDASAIEANEMTTKPYSIIKVDNYMPGYYDSGAMTIIFHSKEEEQVSSSVSVRQVIPLVESSARGGTRSKKHIALEKKTKKLRNSLSVKMEE